MSAREVIVATFKQVASDNQRKLAPLSDDLNILECGVDSLCIAVIVSILEDSLGADPFNSEDFDEFPKTFGEFVRMYDKAITP